MLFLPGNNPNMLINGNCLGADAVIFDLEDAVAPAEKDAARILVRNTMTYLDFSKVETIVRINSVDTDFWKKDLETILPLKPTLIMPPKTSTAQDVLTVDAYMCELEDKLGYERIHAACVCGAETVNPKIQSTVDAYELTQMTDKWEKYHMNVIGPVSVDLALSKDACAHKRFDAPGAGDADLLLVTNYEMGNAIYKTALCLSLIHI